MKGITTRSVDAAASLVFLALAAGVAFEGVRLGAGWDQRGPEPGFFPFWLAILMGFGAAASFLQALRSRRTTPFFETRQEVADLLRAGAPLAAAVIAIPWLGLYVTTFVYVWLFAWWYGEFRWWTALLSGLGFAAATYFTLTKGMRISMPLSVFYERGLLPF